MELSSFQSEDQQKDPPLINCEQENQFYDFPTIQDNEDAYMMRAKEKQSQESCAYSAFYKEEQVCQKQNVQFSSENENQSEKLYDVKKNKNKQILQKSISETKEIEQQREARNVEEKMKIKSNNQKNLKLNLESNEIKLIINSPQKYQQQQQKQFQQNQEKFQEADNFRQKVVGSSFQSIKTKSSFSNNMEQTQFGNISPNNSVISESKSGFISPKKSFLAKRKNNSRFSEKFINNLQIQTSYQQQQYTVRKCSDPLQKRISDPFNLKYDVYEKIGEGSTSTVKRCRIRDQQKDYAVKIQNFKADETLINDILKEQRILSVLNHKNILRSAFFEIDRKTRTSYIGMEFVEGDSLGSLIKKGYKFSLSEIRKILNQILEAVQYMHGCGICHRDMSYNNILYNEKFEKITVIDFSSSLFVLDKNSIFGDEGTLHFKAPETLKGEKQNKNIDIWGVGVTLFAMINGCLPFTGNSNKQIVESVTKFQKFSLEDLKIKDQNLLDLLNNLLCSNPENRINANEALKCQFLTTKMKQEDFQLNKINLEKIKKINMIQLSKRKSSVEDPIIINLFGNNSFQNGKEGNIKQNKGFFNTSQQLRHSVSLHQNK